MANGKEAKEKEVAFQLGAHGLEQVGGIIQEQRGPLLDRRLSTRRTEPPKQGLKIGRPVPANIFAAGSLVDPEKAVRRVNYQLKNGVPIGFYIATKEGETGEVTTDPEVEEVLAEEERKGNPNGPEPSKIQNLPFIPSKLQSPINEDDYGSESRP